MNILKKLDLTIREVNFSELNSDWTTCKFPRPFGNYIPFVRLYFPIEGTGFISEGENEYKLQPGKIFLIPAYANTKVSCPHRLVKYWCHFNANLSDSHIDFFSLYQTPLELDVEDMHFTEMIFKRLLSFSNHKLKSPLVQFEYNNLLWVLLTPFFKASLSHQEKIVGESDRLTELMLYIEENLEQTLSLNILGKKFNMNPHYLSNVFCKQKGVSLIKYCNMRRIARAVSLMLNTQYNISEIAYATGFKTTAHFSKAFQKHTGTTPSSYRKELLT